MNNELSMGYAISFPVLRVKRLPNEVFQITGVVEGTCFSLGNKFMLTAGHVAKAIEQPDMAGAVGLIEPNGRFLKGAAVIAVEVLPCDLGVLQVDFIYEESANWFYTMRWQQEPLKSFDQIRCLGYPYGMYHVEDRKALVQRAFQGHIVADLYEFTHPSIGGKPFPVYELSFPAPCGLSGSPLLTSTGKVFVTGVIIGNSRSRMLVLETEEIEQQDSTRTVVQQYESLTLGIAVQAKEVFSLKSQLLGGTFGEYLERNKLLA
jgi:hypothetical protein